MPQNRTPIDPSYDLLHQRGHHSLDTLFNPRSVAVVGASERQESVGRTLLWNLISNPFGGTVYPINPKRPNVLGIKAWPALRALPEPVDLAVIVTPSTAVPDTGFFKGWLGRFKLIRRYTLRKPEPGGEELGRLYEAYNVLTDNPALVLLPSERAPMEPQEEWRVRLRSQAEPPYVVLEVEKAPSTGRLSQLRGMLELLGTAVERLANNEEARVHLANPPMGLLAFLWSVPGRSWRWVRARRWRTVMAVVLMLLSLQLVIHQVERERYVLDQNPSTPPAARWEAVQQRFEDYSPMLIDMPWMGHEVVAYPLPQKPFIDQAKAPCFPKQGEVEIHGGCWVALEKRPPCFDNQAEYKGKCYLPVSARSRFREPQSIRR